MGSGLILTVPLQTEFSLWNESSIYDCKYVGFLVLFLMKSKETNTDLSLTSNENLNDAIKPHSFLRDQ